MVHHRPPGKMRSPGSVYEGTRRKPKASLHVAARRGPSLPAGEVKFLRGPEGGPGRTPRGVLRGVLGGPGLAHKSWLAPVIWKIASP